MPPARYSPREPLSGGTFALVGAFCCTLLIAGAPLGAQTTSGAIVGTVRDQTNSLLPGAAISIAGPRLIGGARQVETDGLGRYRLTDLPSGTYDVQVSRSGFSTLLREGLVIAAGGIIVVDFTLRVSGPPDSIRVTAPSPMVDVLSPAPHQNIDQSLLRNLPTSRRIRDLINLVPGVLADVAYGGTKGSNAIAADGVDLTEPRLQEPWLHLNQDWVHEVQVTTLGAGAEHGGFTGVRANALLRTGSNRIDALGGFRATPPSWVASNTQGLSQALQRFFAPRRIDQAWEANAQFGGAVVRDRLWYFAGLQHETTDDRPAGYSGETRRQVDDPQGMLKMTAALGPRVRLEGFMHGGRFRALNSGLGPFTAPEAAGSLRRRAVSWKADVRWMAGVRTIVEARTDGFDSPQEFTAPPPATCDGPPPRLDLTTDMETGNVGQCFTSERARSTAAVKVRHHARGSHMVNAGMTVERASQRDAFRIPGDVLYLDIDGAPYQAQLWGGESQTARLPKVAVFAEDEWRPTDRITIVGGLRADAGRARVPADGQVFSSTVISPRVGAALDLGRDHRTVARAHFGRYADPVFGLRMAFADYSDSSPLVTALIAGSGDFVEIERSERARDFAVDPGIRHSHMNQWVIGAERQVAADLSVLVQYIRRRYDRFMGIVDSGSLWTPVTRPDPGPDGVVGNGDDGAPLTAYSRANPGPAAYLFTNPQEAKRRYDALQVVSRRREGGRWQMQASYTWSRAQGNVGNQLHANAGAFELGNPGNFVNPNRLINAYGRSPFDPTHEVKLLGTGVLRLRGTLNVSGVYRYATGYAWGRQVNVFGLAQGSARIRVEPNGVRRVAPTNTLDLRIEQTARVRAGIRIGVFLDVFNLGNRGVPDSAQSVPVNTVSGPRFGEPLAWTDPRTLRVGVRWFLH